MAQFSDLSVELLLHIASFLRVNRPGNSTQSTRETMLKTRNECVREASEALRRARASLFNLSVVNKTWRQLLFKESYRVVSIHGAYAANQLIDLFRVLYNNPTISNSIEEFVLHIEIEDNPNRIALDNMAYLLSPDLPRLSEDEEVIEGSQASYLALLDSYYDESPTIRNSKYIIWAAGLVLSRLTHLTDLTLSVSDHTLIHGHLILFGSFSTRFPSLKSITLEDAVRSNDSADLSYDLHWDPYCHGLEPGRDLRLCRSSYRDPAPPDPLFYRGTPPSPTTCLRS
ncbi:hypothetical protein CKAH01_15407 [Colletotrichum kahawae]|uniref:Uncharacterized protein n=1 Tax=Colletotrichum kahawae TaxID=34407 RepID=A0AAD9YGP5_COLKA|nr:hypothetical protein CKAH01_15407 [Colletotrichum kahawae]